MMASRQYASNQFGMSNGDPKKKKGSDDAVKVCSKDNPAGCGAYAGGGQATNAQNTGGAKGLSSKPQYASKVVSKKEAEKRAKEMEKIRANAPAMKTQTKKQREAVAGPPKPKNK